MKKTIYNALVFNVAWLVCVLGGDVVAVLTAVTVISIHLKFFSGNNNEALVIVVVMLIGFLLDTALIRTGLLVPPTETVWPPLWLISLWGLFATTLNHSMKWFQGQRLISVVMGGVAGTLTYLAGTRLTDFSLKSPLNITVAVIFLLWCVAFPVCLAIAKKMLAEPKPKPAKG